MNFSYLMQYVSHHLNTFVRRYSLSGELLDSCCARIQFDDEPVGKIALSLFSSFQDMNDINPLPMILNINEHYVYAWVPDKQYQYIIGPVRFLINPDFKYRIAIGDQGKTWRESIPLCKFGTFAEDCLLLYNLESRDILTDNDFYFYNITDPNTELEVQKYYSNLIFENREAGKRHNPYDQEIREFTSIEEGNIDQLQQSLNEVYLGEIGTLAKNPLRNMKNRGIVVITLACRAAMRGGVEPELAYSLSDSYIQKLEECSEIQTVFHLFHSAEYQYARLVHDIKSQRNADLQNEESYHVNRCKNYIFANLHGKIQVQDIAEKMGLNANYLSELFHKSEHIPLKDYIQREKIHLAKNLLIYSNYSYSEIATYLGYSSQSHLGKQFKKYTEMTPRKYREYYGVKEFLE